MQKTSLTVAGRAVWVIERSEWATVLRSWLWLAGTYTLPEEQDELMKAVTTLDAGGIEARLVAANRLGNLVDLYRPIPPPITPKT